MHKSPCLLPYTLVSWMYISSKDIPEEGTQMDPSVLPDSVRYMEEDHRRHIIKLWNSKHSHTSS